MPISGEDGVVLGTFGTYFTECRTPTDDERADQKIAQVLKRGFVRSDKQLRPEEVVILRFRGRKD